MGGVIVKSFTQRVLEKFIQTDAFVQAFKSGTLIAKQIAFSVSSESGMLFEFPHFFDNKVINGFRRHIVQAFIIQQIFLTRIHAPNKYTAHIRR